MSEPTQSQSTDVWIASGSAGIRWRSWPWPRLVLANFVMAWALSCFEIPPGAFVSPGGSIRSDSIPKGPRTSSNGTGLGGRARNKWSKSELAYRVTGPVEDADLNTLSALYMDAAEAYARLVPLEIREAGANEPADIEIELCAPCASPPCCEPLREDSVEFWGWAELPSGDEPVRQIVQVFDQLQDPAEENVQFALVLHELGHSLGLVHADDIGAVMHESIDRESRGAARAVLSQVDIGMIQDLYGSRDGMVAPIIADLPVDPSQVEDPTPDGPDTDEDGLSDIFEELVSRTDPASKDTDGDGVEDGFEVQFGLDPKSTDSDADGSPDGDELAAGTFARAPLICNAPGQPAGVMEVWIAQSLFEDLGLVEGEEVTISNARNGCSVDGVIVHKVGDSPCTVSMARALRETLCIFQLNIAVPIRVCRTPVIDTLFDFQEPIRPPITNEGNEADVLTTNGERRLEFRWTLDNSPDDAWVVLEPEVTMVKPCDRVVCDVEVSSAVTLRKELKTNLAETRDTNTLVLPPGIVHTMEVAVSSQYPLGEIAFVVEKDLNPGLSAGTVWVDNIRFLHAESSPPPPSAASIIWTDVGTDTIRRANLDGTSVEELPISGLLSPQGIAVDPVGFKIYWTDSLTDKIQRAGLDGSGVEDLPISGLISPRGIGVDSLNKKIYWTDSGTDTIGRANLDGTSAEELPISGLLSPQGIVVDPAGGKIYWIDSLTDKIQRADLDGTDAEDLPISGLISPQGIAMDPLNKKIYWTDNGADAIRRANLDGTSVEELPISGLLSPQGIVIDPEGGKIYWADSLTDKIHRADLDGTDVEDLPITGLQSPQGVALLPVAVGFEPGRGIDKDGDGVFDDLDECPATESLLAVDDRGCAANQRDSDEDGVNDDLDDCPGTTGGIVDQVGCVLDGDGDGVPDQMDQCPGTTDVAVDSTGCPLDLPPEVSVASIILPGGVIGGIGPRNYGVALRNSGSTGTAATARVCIQGNCGETTVQVPAFGEATGFVSLLTPLSSGACGGLNEFTVTACSLLLDSTPSNDCLNVQLPIAVPIWDLEFEILDAPSRGRICNSVSWTVQVTNVGNISSEPRCWRTGICLNSACGDYGACAGFPLFVLTFNVNSLAPGQSLRFPVTYGMNCGALIGTQYLKAGVDVFNGCTDVCPAGNDGCRAITIDP